MSKGEIVFPATCVSCKDKVQFLMRFEKVIRTVEHWCARWFNVGLTKKEWNDFLDVFAHYMNACEDPTKSEKEHRAELDTKYPYKEKLIEPEFRGIQTNETQYRNTIVNGMQATYRNSLQDDMTWSKPISEPISTTE